MTPHETPLGCNMLPYFRQPYKEQISFFLSLALPMHITYFFPQEMTLFSEGNLEAYPKQNKPRQRAALGLLHRSRLMATPPGNTEALGPALSVSACHHDIRCLRCPYIIEWKGCRPWTESIHSPLLTLCLFPKQDISVRL